MATLANLLYDLGNEVSGYDDVVDYKFTQEGLDKRGINIFYDSTHDIDKDTIVTYSKAFSEDHKELTRVRKMGLTIKKYNELIGDLTDKYKTISVSGTHGKTTTSSLITHVLNDVYGCNYFIGDGSGHANSQNKLFVIESDEFSKHFLAYHPTVSVITNVEAEHLECYDGLEDIIDTFAKFANINTKEKVIVCGDNENIRKIKFDKWVRYYGFNEDNDTFVKNIVLNSDGSSFDVYRDKEFYGHFEVPLFGKHMILNALACIEVCILEGISSSVIHDKLKTFKNAKRRFAIEEVNDTIIIDDYAHHPTEIEVTINSARQKYPDRKLIAVFKPNTYSRTRDFTEDFIRVLSDADKAYVTEIECNREKAEDYPGVTSHSIIEKLDNGDLISDESVAKLLDYRGNVILFMSCADVSHMKKKLISLLK